MMAQFSLHDHLASMGPKIKGGKLWRLGSHIKATGMIWKSIYQQHYPILSKHHSRPAVGYIIPLHRRSHRGQRYVCKHPFLDLISGRKISVYFLTRSLPLRTLLFIMP